MGGGYCKTVKPLKEIESLKAVLFSVLLLSFLLLSTTFISCAGGASGPKGSEAEGTALAIKLPDTAKTIYNKEDIVSFTVTVSSGSFNSTKSANKGETLLFSNLPVGNYSVKAYGKTSRGAVAAKCETSVTIVAGETTTTTLHLSRLEHWTVTFINEDGSTITTQDVSDGYTATKPADPAPSAGKLFSFWTADATVGASSTPFDFNTPITGDTTLKPVFGVITYTVKYVSPVGSFTASDFTAANASSYSLPSTSSVTGLTFADWYSDATFSSSVDAASVRDITTFTKKDDLHYEKSIYAKWTAKVQFKGENISTGAMTSLGTDVTVTYGGKVSNPGDPTVPTGATFGGWCTGTVNESTGKVTLGSAYNFNSTVTKDLILYAKWNFVMHNVTYVSVPQDVPDGTETEFREVVGIPTLPTITPEENSGLTFVGWTDSEEFTLDTTPLTSVPANTTEDVTLYAIWKVAITICKSDGSTDSTLYTLYGKPLSAPTTTPTAPEGATFSAWYKGTSATNVSSTAYDFTDETLTVTSKFCLFAKWNYTNFTGSIADLSFATFTTGNSTDSPYTITITGSLVDRDFGNLSNIIKTSGVYADVDLSGCTNPYTSSGYDWGIGSSRFKNNTYLVKITLPTDSKFKNIDDSAFEGCTNLKNVTLSGNVGNIGKNAFKGCTSITSFIIPSSVKTVYSNSFAGLSGLTKAEFKIMGDYWGPARNIELFLSNLNYNESSPEKYTR